MHSTSQAAPHAGRSAFASRIACGLIFAGLVVFAADSVRYGLNLTDEGMKLSVPLRYALGDLPFRDEILTAGRSFGVVLWPVFALWPDVTILELRYLSAALQLASALAFFVLLARYAPPPLVALATAATAFLARVGFWTPGYNILGVHLLQLAIALWLLGCVLEGRGRSRAAALSGGVAFALGATAYNAFVLTLVVPAAVLLIHGFRGNPQVVRATAGFLAVAVTLLVAAIAATSLAGLADDWRASVALLSGAPVYSKSILERLSACMASFVRWGPQILSVAATLAAAALVLRRLPPERAFGPSWAMAVVVGLVLLLVTGMTVPGIRTAYQISFYVMAAALGMMLLVAGDSLWQAFRDRREPQSEREWPLVLWSGTSMLLIACCLHALTSGNGFFNFRHAIGPVFTLAIVGLHRGLFAPRGAGVSRPAFGLGPVAPTLVVVCTFFAAVHLPERAAMIYGDRARSHLTTSFSHPLLEGIRTTPERVRHIESLLAFLEPRLSHGETLLEYGGAPILYYLTRTRPAAPIVWMSPRTDEAIRRHALGYMLEEDRIPQYVVRTGMDKRVRFVPGDPINDFIERNYAKIRKIASFEIWQRR